MQGAVYTGDALPFVGLPAWRDMAKVIAASKAPEVSIEVAEDGQSILVDGIRFPATPHDGTPVPKSIQFVRDCYVDITSPSKVAELLPFASKDDTRLSLHGVAIEMYGDGGTVAVATDGHRLAVRTLGFAPRDLDSARESCLIPKPIVECLAKMKDPVVLRWNSEFAEILGDGFRFAWHNSYRFPDHWPQVIPTGLVHVADVPASVIEAAKLATRLDRGQRGCPGSVIDIAPLSESNQAEISASYVNAEGERQVAGSVIVDRFAAFSETRRYNAQYMLDAFLATGSNGVSFVPADDLLPCRVSGNGTDVYVMGMRL